MADRKPGYELARRRLGDALRLHRERANVRIEAAARELECSAAKISRLENGLGPAKLWEIRVLLDLYGVANRAARSRMERWAKESKEPGWWEQEAGDLMSAIRFHDPNLYLAAETEASRIRTYCTPVLPALLQTADYAAAHTRARHPDWSASQIERFTALRLKRQEAVLSESDPLRLEAVLDEGAVRRVVGGPEIHRTQLLWLADRLDELAASGRDALQVRVLPFSAGVPGLAMTAFSIFNPRQPDIDPIVYQEETLGGLWASVENVPEYSRIFDDLVASALGTERTRTLLRVIAEES
jgi:Domain of unknown function (DUF5753)/Helix-turn-helix domain